MSPSLSSSVGKRPKIPHSLKAASVLEPSHSCSGESHCAAVPGGTRERNSQCVCHSRLLHLRILMCTCGLGVGGPPGENSQAALGVQGFLKISFAELRPEVFQEMRDPFKYFLCYITRWAIHTQTHMQAQAGPPPLHHRLTRPSRSLLLLL